MLGPDAPLRFLPSRFDPSGVALDAHDRPCHFMACPRCHLSVPRELLFVPPNFISVVGAPGSGKSYLLAAMTHTLRRRLPQSAMLVMTDADAEANLILADNERVLFHAPDASEAVYLRKTEVTGTEMYLSAFLDGRQTLLPKPFLFSIRPTARHAAYNPADPGMVTVLYDNAGESFIPGADTEQSPVTRHVAKSRAIIFVFDPTKDAAFRSRLSGSDPQLSRLKDVHRQDVMLNEMSLRVRRLLNLSPGQRHTASLILLVAKYDLWRGLLGADIGQTPLYPVEKDSIGVLAERQFNSVSLAVREMLSSICPEIVAAAEASWECVRYLPVSATGCSPTFKDDTGLLVVRPDSLTPIWTETALAWLISRWRPDWLPEWRPAPGPNAVRPARLRKSGHLLIAEMPDGRILEAPADYANRVVLVPKFGCEVWLADSPA